VAENCKNSKNLLKSLFNPLRIDSRKILTKFYHTGLGPSSESNMFAVKECDSCATFETWLNISSGPLVALVSKLMLCFHHLEQVNVFTPAPRVIMIGLFLEMSDNLDIDGDDDNCCTLLMQFFTFF